MIPAISELTDLAGKMAPPLALEIIPVEIEVKTAIVVDVPECDYRHNPATMGHLAYKAVRSCASATKTGICQLMRCSRMSPGAVY